MLKLITLLSKGILRDTQARRKFMFWVMVAALVMLFCGAAISEQWAREHPWSYVAYWFVCGWLTLTGMMVALFDMLIVRTAHRVARRKLEKQLRGEIVEDEDPK